MWRLEISIAVTSCMNGRGVHIITLYNKSVNYLASYHLHVRVLLQSGDPVNTCLLHVLREFRG